MSTIGSSSVNALMLVSIVIIIVLSAAGVAAHRICSYLEHRFRLLPVVPSTYALRIGLRFSTMSILTELVILFTGFGTPGTAVVLLIGILLQWACFTRLDTLRSTNGFTQLDSSR